MNALQNIRRIRGNQGAASTSDRMHALTFSGISDLGVLGLSQQTKSDQRRTLTALNLQNALNDSARKVIASIGNA